MPSTLTEIVEPEILMPLPAEYDPPPPVAEITLFVILIPVPAVSFSCTSALLTVIVDAAREVIVAEDTFKPLACTLPLK